MIYSKASIYTYKCQFKADSSHILRDALVDIEGGHALAQDIFIAPARE
ncbi:hypothetical protein G3341_02580 [Providencia vermicola]|nr:hypothetical protein [Providencia vermicola]QIC14661.1 hypothetical protein G3341_02580 [Providencia vermicola]